VNDALTSGTALVTLGLANSEVGVIQNLACLADPIRASGALFHVDAVQAAGRIPVSVDALGCDLMTLSGHKLGTPAGIGALYIREPERMMPLTFGGPQESALRPGTPNLLGAVAFGVVARTDFSAESERIGSLSMHLLTTLRALIPGLELNGPEDGRLPNTLTMAFPGVAGESMLMALDLGGVEVAMGSACAAGSVEPSHVLLAMGQNRGRARSSIRLSLGWCTTGNEVEQAAREIVRAWRRVREAEPMIPAHEDLQ
jgi:cysteine desulfurase